MPTKRRRSGSSPVAPLAGAWIEIHKGGGDAHGGHKSLPSRERGLKSLQLLNTASEPLSLPSRERGLKSLAPEIPDKSPQVAPLAGAWIEIAYPGRNR